jgi:hypothetical protein
MPNATWTIPAERMMQLVIDAPYFEGRLIGTDTMITDVGSASLES